MTGGRRSLRPGWKAAPPLWAETGFFAGAVDAGTSAVSGEVPELGWDPPW